MADAFIGFQVLVTVRGAQLKGTVSSFEAGASLTLSNVWRLDTGQWEPRITLRAADILDLSEIPASPVLDYPAAAATATATSTATVTAIQAPNPLAAPDPAPAFLDPAIVAVGKKPTAAVPVPVPGAPIEPHPQSNIGEKRDPQPFAGRSTSQGATPTATLTTSVEGLSITVAKPAVDAAQSGEEEEIIEVQISGRPSQEARRRPRRGNRKPRNGVQEDVGASPQPAKSKAAGQGKGWRETPMLQTTASFQPYSSLKRNGTKGKAANDNNGWASEDVTDVQEAGDFDFEGELAKFNKPQLFEQMRKDDKIDESERLVSYNRQPRPKPGTGGGKNLHHSENVLEEAQPSASSRVVVKEKPGRETPNDFWNSEADEGVPNGAERLSGRDMGSRQSSRRGESKMSASRRSQSRKASAVTSGQPTRVNSGVSTQPYTIRISRPSSRLSITVIDKKKQLAASTSQQGLYLLPSNRKLETVSALQMLNLENIAHNELGLTEDMMTENAGRGIAEVTLTALNDPAIKVRHAAMADASGTTPPATVVILAGNNKSGIRAVAAARHLRNKNVNVLVCVVGIERDRELLEDMRQQMRLFRSFGGQLLSKRDLFNHLRKASIPTLTIDTPRTAPLSSMAANPPSPVTLIVDALLGLAISFEELRTGDQATVYELIEWANRNEAFVLAIDVPTGIDPTSGKVSVIDGNPLYVRPRYVVALGAPKRGLLEAVVAGEHEDDGETVSGNAALADDAATDWRLFLADIGLGAAVWKRAGTKMRRGIDFDDKWVLEMKYRGVPEQEDDLLV